MAASGVPLYVEGSARRLPSFLGAYHQTEQRRDGLSSVGAASAMPCPTWRCPVRALRFHCCYGDELQVAAAHATVSRSYRSVRYGANSLSDICPNALGRDLDKKRVDHLVRLEASLTTRGLTHANPHLP